MASAFALEEADARAGWRANQNPEAIKTTNEERRNRMKKSFRSLFVAAAAVALLATASPVQADGRHPNPGILPPDSAPYGKTYGEWAAAWWQWAMSIPADRNPLTDATGEFFGEGQSGQVWFRGTFGSSGERTSTMPAGKALFMPVYNWIFGAGVFDCDPTVPGVPCDVPVLQAAAAANTEKAEVMEVTIDGVPVRDIRSYRAVSPEPFSVTYPDNSVVGVPAGTYAPNVTDGYWLMLAPLPKGRHTITVHVRAPDTLFGLIEFTSVTHLTVVDTIYKTDFEPPTYTEDLPLVGQDGWTAPPPLSPNAAVVSRDRPRLGRQTVHVLGADLEHQDFINEVTAGYYDAIGSYRRAVNYDTANAQTIRISAWVRVDGPKTTTGNNFFSASIGGRAATTLNGEPSSAGVGELAISSDGNAYAYSGNDNVPVFLASTHAAPGQWHRLSIIADFSERASSFFVDGRPIGTFEWDPNEIPTGVLLRGSVLAYAAPDTATNKKADYASHYDRFSIRIVRDRDCDDE